MSGAGYFNYLSQRCYGSCRPPEGLEERESLKSGLFSHEAALESESPVRAFSVSDEALAVWSEKEIRLYNPQTLALMRCLEAAPFIHSPSCKPFITLIDQRIFYGIKAKDDRVSSSFLTADLNTGEKKLFCGMQKIWRAGESFFASFFDRLNALYVLNKDSLTFIRVSAGNYLGSFVENPDKLSFLFEKYCVAKGERLHFLSRFGNESGDRIAIEYDPDDNCHILNHVSLPGIPYIAYLVFKNQRFFFHSNSSFYILDRNFTVLKVIPVRVSSLYLRFSVFDKRIFFSGNIKEKNLSQIRVYGRPFCRCKYDLKSFFFSLDYEAGVLKKSEIPDLPGIIFCTSIKYRERIVVLKAGFPFIQSASYIFAALSGELLNESKKLKISADFQLQRSRLFWKEGNKMQVRYLS